MSYQAPAFASPPLALASAITLAGLSGTAQADEIYELDKVIVTASRTAQSIDETLAPVTVITREDIERSQASSVTELLNKVPGVQITSNGGPGSQSGIYIRGTKSAQTLVIIDGHRINSASSGDSPLQYLDPDQIDRIEIVRGPRSSLYGADALGGVIQIVTRKGSGAPQLVAKAGIGTQATGEYSLNYSGEVGGTRFSLGAKLYETQGYDRTTNLLGSDADDDAYRNKAFSGSISRIITEDIEIGMNFSQSKGKSEYDNSYGSSWHGAPVTLFDLININTFITANLNEVWFTKFDLGFVRDEREDFNGQFGNSTATNERYSISWQNDLAWSDNQLLITGIDYSNDEVESSRNYEESARYNAGIYFQNITSFDTSELQLAARHDKNEAYGSNSTGSISWGFDLPNEMRLVTSYGTAFRAPTFGDLYDMGGSPDLKAETSQNAELELKGKFDSQYYWSVNLYLNDMKDMLEYTSEYKMKNIAGARIRGLEFSLSTVVLKWNINSNLTFINPEYTEGDYSGKTLYRRAEQLFNIDVDRDFGHWTFGSTLRTQGSSWNDQENTQEVAGFATIDVRASIKVTSELKTQLKLVNLMDKKYTTTQGYTDQPRSAYLAFIWTPSI